MDEKFIIDQMIENHLDDVLDIENDSFNSPWSRDLFLNELELNFSWCFVIKRVAEGKKK